MKRFFWAGLIFAFSFNTVYAMDCFGLCQKNKIIPISSFYSDDRLLKHLSRTRVAVELFREFPEEELLKMNALKRDIDWSKKNMEKITEALSTLLEDETSENETFAEDIMRVAKKLYKIIEDQARSILKFNLSGKDLRKDGHAPSTVKIASEITKEAKPLIKKHLHEWEDLKIKTTAHSLAESMAWDRACELLFEDDLER